MLKVAIPVVLVMTLVAGVASAQDTDTSPCPDTVNGQGRAACLVPLVTAAQARLDDIMGRLRASRLYASGDTQAINSFETSAALWQSYMQQTCDPLAASAPDDLKSSAPLDCRLIMLQDRRRLLETVYHGLLYN